MSFATSRLEGEWGTYQLILVGGDGREDGLWENVGAELFALQIDDRTRIRFEAADQVHARLVPVHRI